jgi:hypothetical protein
VPSRISEDSSMSHCSRWIAVASLCAALAVPAVASAQPGDSVPKDGKKTPASRKPAAILQELIDTADIEQRPLPLSEVLGWLRGHLEKRGMPLTVEFDSEGFREESADVPDPLGAQVKVPAFSRKVTVAQFLRSLLKQLPQHDGAMLVLGDRVVLTTANRASLPFRLAAPFVADYDNRKLGEVLHELADKTGITIVTSPRAADKLDRPISATFRGDLTLGAALRMLTELAELKAVVLDGGGILVTTADQVAAIRNDAAAEAILHYIRMQAGLYGGFGGGGFPGGPGNRIVP